MQDEEPRLPTKVEDPKQLVLLRNSQHPEPLEKRAAINQCVGQELNLHCPKARGLPYPFQLLAKELHPQYRQHEKPMRVVTACLKSYLQLIARIPDFTNSLLGFSGGLKAE